MIVKWERDIHDEETIRFLSELISLYEKYDRSIAHEDAQGSFIIEKNNEFNRNWILAARNEV